MSAAVQAAVEEDPLSYFFHFCYKRFREDESGGRSLYDLVYLPPHSIIYEHHFPKHWLYYEGVRLYKKSGKDVGSDVGSIFSAMTEDTDESSATEVVATFVTYAAEAPPLCSRHPGWGQDVPGHAPPHVRKLLGGMATVDFGDHTFSVAFLTRGTLLQFLQERGYRAERGILQKYVPPRGKHTETIKVHWTPRITSVVRRMNTLGYLDTKHPIYERHMSAKHHPEHVVQAQVAPFASEQLVSIVSRIVSDFEAQHSDRLKVSHATFFFQPAKKTGEVVLLFCNLFRVAVKPGLPLPPAAAAAGSVQPKAARAREKKVRPSSASEETADDDRATFAPPPPPPPPAAAAAAAAGEQTFAARVEAALRADPAAGARAAPAAGNAPLQSLRAATSLEKFLFFRDHVYPRYAPQVLKQASFTPEGFLLRRFDDLMKEVAVLADLEAEKRRRVADRKRALHHRPQTLSQLALSMLAKQGPVAGGSSGLDSIVCVVLGSQHAVVGAAIAVVVAVSADCSGRRTRSLHSALTQRVRNLREAARIERKITSLVDTRASNAAARKLTFSAPPSVVPRNRREVKFTSPFELLLGHHVHFSYTNGPGGPVPAYGTSTRLNVTLGPSVAAQREKNTLERKQNVIKKRHARRQAALKREEIQRARLELAFSAPPSVVPGNLREVKFTSPFELLLGHHVHFLYTNGPGGPVPAYGTSTRLNVTLGPSVAAQREKNTLERKQNVIKKRHARRQAALKREEIVL
ncbi:hypothetical protein DIPPA_22112 [Diplonema papillatum]|nr:hypothetical protein DIPPA_22112 [Diplonema papillatum]